MSRITIQKIQFKRGTKEDLESYLVGDKKPQLGEPVFEIDTQRLKFGDGVNDYILLPYFNTSTAIDFAIQDPISGQVLVYDNNNKCWKNVEFIGSRSIEALKNDDGVFNGIGVSDYETAINGQMPVKSDSGFDWVTPINDAKLKQYEDEAKESVMTANSHALSASNSAIECGVKVNEAARINGLTLEFVNKKFWWGTVEEYNALTEIKEGTIYCIMV